MMKIIALNFLTALMAYAQNFELKYELDDQQDYNLDLSDEKEDGENAAYDGSIDDEGECKSKSSAFIKWDMKAKISLRQLTSEDNEFIYIKLTTS